MKKAYKILFVILTPLAILSIAFSIYFFQYINNKNEEIYNIAAIDMNSLDMSQDFYHYDQIGYKTIIGVDLSEHNKDVDFNVLKQQGIEFAFLRLGWRGYVDPTIHLDARFEEYYKKAKDSGIQIGVYFFSQAISKQEAKEEAEYVIENIQDKEIDLYVVYDYETIESKLARTTKLSKSERTNNAREFLSTIEEYGYKPMLYTNMYWIKYNYDFLLLLDYPIWFAQYSKSPQYKGNHIIWQYATEMELDGVSSKDGADLNLMIIKEDIN